MSFVSLLFCANLILCVINVVSGDQDETFFFAISKEGLFEGDLSTEYSFEEGVEYTVQCLRRSDWDLHWEVEPYGLKSSTCSSKSGGVVSTRMTFKLNRDDHLTIGCYSKNEKNLKKEQKTATFIWNKKVKPMLSTQATTPVLMDSRDDADDNHKCYEKNNTEKCVFFLISKEFLNGNSSNFGLQIYTRKNHTHNNLNYIDIDKCYNNCYCTNTNENFFCDCKQGFIKNATGWCEDANECQMNICKFGERCWNIKGSYLCCPKATILDEDKYCVCPESENHIYYQTWGCIYDQCLNTTCGVGAECSMAKAKPVCYCPYGTTGNPHAECVDRR